GGVIETSRSFMRMAAYFAFKSMSIETANFERRPILSKMLLDRRDTGQQCFLLPNSPCLSGTWSGWESTTSDAGSLRRTTSDAGRVQAQARRAAQKHVMRCRIRRHPSLDLTVARCLGRPQ